MATINQVLHRMNSSGSYDDIYLKANMANVTGTLGVSNGGTGLGTLTSGSFLKGNGTSAVTLRTPAEVLSDIGAAASTHTHTKANITDFPTSMPASDVYSWAKASTKPSYSASEVGAAASTHGHDAATTSAAGFMSTSDKTKLDGLSNYTHPTTKQCNYSYTHPSAKQCNYSYTHPSSKQCDAAAGTHSHDASTINVTANVSYTTLFPRGQSLFADNATISGLVNGAIAWLYS